MVATRRLDIIELLLRPIQTAVDKLLRPDQRNRGNFLCGRSSYYDSENAECEALMLGKLIQFLVSSDLWPVPEPSSYEYSASQLMDLVRTLSLDSIGIEHLYNHQSCFPIPKLEETLDAIANGQTRLTSPEQTRLLSAQAKKSGLSF